jgi:hypothetical protein
MPAYVYPMGADGNGGHGQALNAFLKPMRKALPCGKQRGVIGRFDRYRM